MARANSTTKPAGTHQAGQRVGYVRVSTVDQNTARQLDGVALHKVFTDHASGGTADRPQLAEALRYIREGDCLVVHSMDRLARNLDDLRRIVRELTGRGVSVEFVKEAQTFTPESTNPMAQLMLSMLGAFAEFERSLIRERQREGIAIARQDPEKYRGRAPALTPERAELLREKDREQGGKGRAALAREFGISRETLYQYLRAESSATGS
ncbi:recombinase family protein [Ideonella sp.]|uniref:recombinase family protein n=1 Tax=Ideonella sp. TaxID=1929293 RepID=UPI0035B33619